MGNEPKLPKKREPQSNPLAEPEHENIEGNFVQGRANNSAGSTDGEANYVENLGGQDIVVDEGGEVTETAKRSGWFF